jgi:hypothetical protein
MTAEGNPRGKSGLHEERVPGNARPGQPEGKRHREETAPAQAGVMVKRWSKSPPQVWQQDWHGKPHPEQCRIGASRGLVPAFAGIPPQGYFSPEVRVGSLIALVTSATEEWSSKGGNPRDRTRLTGHPHIFNQIEQHLKKVLQVFSQGHPPRRGGGLRAHRASRFVQKRIWTDFALVKISPARRANGP